MNILLVYPQCPDSFWNFKHALKFISKKAAVPPLGLITVSAMLPPSWQKKLVDMNVDNLQPDDIQWADYVFISAMYIQKESVSKIIGECKKRDKKIVAGGPLFTQEFENYPQIDHFILNEAEITMPLFLKDLDTGQPQHVYQTDNYADMKLTPVPDFHLLKMKEYAAMNLQIARGCPFACDFCEITSLLGHQVRMKETVQVIGELEALYKLKWRGSVAIVDDNLIGNRKTAKSDLLPAIGKWMKEHHHPFSFSAQTSINLADDSELMALMTEAGFQSTFIGIESPDEMTLEECNKVQNKKRDMLESIKKIQNAGLLVSGGFIVGFDSDSPGIFQRQIDFIQKSGIVSAMVGLLNAPKNTGLYHRLQAENRIRDEATGSNTDLSMNFVPKMDTKDLLDGYQKIIRNIYGIKPYYQRLRRLLMNYNRTSSHQTKISFSLFKALFKSILIIGFLNKGRGEYWKLVVWTLFKRPRTIIDALTYTVYGYHFRKVFGV